MAESDLGILRAFALKVGDNLSASTFNKFQYAFPDAGVGSYDKAKSRIAFLSGFKAVHYDCCVNSCVCYTGPHEDRSQCPKCKEPRLDARGQPRKQFSYQPLIPRLRALFANRDYAACMKYRAHEHASARQAGTTSDVFDSGHYRSLLTKPVVVGDKTCNHTYFADPRDIALGFATDGFAPFRKRKFT
ncbi:hypothetical protein FA95DRAFT_1462458, partial [Auriscalpium vulgare]